MRRAICVTIDNDRAQNVTTWRTCRIQGMIYRYSSSLPSVDAAKLSGDMHLLPAGSKTVGRYALACHSRIQGKGTGNEEDKQRKGKGKVRKSQGIIRKNAQRKYVVLLIPECLIIFGKVLGEKLFADL